MPLSSICIHTACTISAHLYIFLSSISQSGSLCNTLHNIMLCSLRPSSLIIQPATRLKPISGHFVLPLVSQQASGKKYIYMLTADALNRKGKWTTRFPGPKPKCSQICQTFKMFNEPWQVTSVVDTGLHRYAHMRTCCRAVTGNYLTRQTFVVLQTMSCGSVGHTRLLSINTAGLQGN